MTETSKPAPAGVMLVIAVLAAVVVHLMAPSQFDKPPPVFVAFLLLGGGVFAACGAILDWEFFMNHRKARLFAEILGRTGARGLYAAIGGGLAAFGVHMVLAGPATGTI